MRFQEFSKFTIRPHLFENKQQYKQIMDTMVNADIISQERANEKLKEVKAVLKRADRIIWWLRWWRIRYTGEVIDAKIQEVSNKWEFVQSGRDPGPDAPQSEEEMKQQVQQLENLYKKITKKDFDFYLNKETGLNREFAGAFNILTLGNHWSTMFEQSPQVNAVEWEANLTPIELLRRLERAEEEWKQKQREDIEPEPDDQIIIDYGKYAWVKLDREYCELEGRAMGHCGNTATPKEGDRILSFRTKVSGGKQRPHLTFILDKNGYLGEMKGRANEKPSEKYHPYIIDLLQKDFVKGIKGGGYLPESNFSITDLDQEQMNALISKKPFLITPEEAYTYAVEKVEGRWPEGEEAIKQDPDYALGYAADVIGERWPEAEDVFKQSPNYAFYYAMLVINGRWTEGEEVIKKDPFMAYRYAKEVIEGRWPEAEETIAQSSQYAYSYATGVVGDRWPEGEDAIKQNPQLWERYKDFVENNNE